MAVSGSDAPEALWNALDLEQISADSLGEAERAGLIVQGRRLGFSHPLARSAIYHGTPPAERRAAHRVLASTTERDQAAWHEAMAATAPDEDVAAALDDAAVKARGRGGRAAEAAAPELAGGEEAAGDLNILHMLAWTWELSGFRERALELIRECAERVELGTVVAVDFANRFLFLEDYEAARELFDQVVAHNRDVGALQFLGYALDMRALLEARTGSLASAYALSLEALQLTEPFEDTTTTACLARLAHIEAILGRSADALEHGRRSLRISEKRGDRWNIVRARSAHGLEALARGDAAGAVEWLAPAAEMLVAGGHG